MRRTVLSSFILALFLAAPVLAGLNFWSPIGPDGGEILAGSPFVANVKVLGVIDGETRGPKIRVFKKKRRKGMRRTKGHRSTYTRVRITDIIA